MIKQCLFPISFFTLKLGYPQSFRDPSLQSDLPRSLQSNVPNASPALDPVRVAVGSAQSPKSFNMIGGWGG